MPAKKITLYVMFTMAGMASLSLLGQGLRAQSSAPAPEPFTLSSAVVFALKNNPELAALRQQHDIDAAAIVIAQTYPFNPTFDVRVSNAHGADVTNQQPYELALLFEVELRRQGKYRRMAAEAGLSHTDWDIASHEATLAVRVARAYQTVLYRHEKLELIQRTVELNQAGYERALKVRDDPNRKISAADIVLARTEVSDARSQVATAQINLASAMAELRRALGITGEPIGISGQLQRCIVPAAALEQVAQQNGCGSTPAIDKTAAFIHAAMEHRADLHGHEAAVQEAQARAQLARADRFGNPTIGPTYQFNETSDNFIGVQLSVPLAVFNTRRGDIMQREAELNRAALELDQTQIQIRQDVESALVAYERAREGLRVMEKEVLPELQAARDALEKLFQQADPSVDVLRLLDVRRKLLHAQDAYLDALWEVCQAQADLAAAVGWIDIACLAP
jgi:outer membrane protein TolC